MDLYIDYCTSPFADMFLRSVVSILGPSISWNKSKSHGLLQGKEKKNFAKNSLFLFVLNLRL